MVALENYKDRLWGSISWQIYRHESNTPVKGGDSNPIRGRRLNIAYSVPWK